jgi:hypothetical protein
MADREITFGKPVLRERQFPGPFAMANRASLELPFTPTAQGSTRVLIRFGTSPTGMRAICLNVSVSMADTDRSAEFET